MSRPAIVAVVLLAALAMPVSHAQSGIRRCVSSDGQLIFTDRACGDVQAVESIAPDNAPGTGVARVAIVRSCARKPEDLLFEVRSALEAQDVNRLASSYLWTGMGTREGYSLLNRLSTFSARPLVDVQLISSVPEFDSTAPEFLPPDNSAAQSLAEDMPAPPEPPPREPDLIRIDQMHSDKDAASETSYFRIVPAAGCLWIRY